MRGASEYDPETLNNEETLAHYGCQAIKKKLTAISSTNFWPLSNARLFPQSGYSRVCSEVRRTYTRLYA
jgi:hypothetical protein